MKNDTHMHNVPTQWYAIKTRQDFKAERILGPLCEEVFFPKETITLPGRKSRTKAVIPHVVFIKTSRANALDLESTARQMPEQLIPFWIYRYPDNDEIQVISDDSISLLRLLTSEDTTGCRIFNKSDFRENEHVRIIGGPYQGYEGYVQRVKKNKHVIVKIEGICLVMLPFIHPDLLEKTAIHY